MDTTVPFHVDARSATPIYDQIITQVKYAIASGTLQRGDALPSVRQLAVSLRVNPNTVARAYRDLETEGVVETKHGRGTFVGGAERRLSPAARRKVLGPAVHKLAGEAHALGIPPQELGEIVVEAAKKLETARSLAGGKP